ncbi:MAG: protocatechuate 3,4-dioxygenase subunit beta [Chloroflexota bacterium]
MSVERDPDPPSLYPDYLGTRLRAPGKPLAWLPRRQTEATGPVFGDDRVRPGDADLTTQHEGEPQGQRIIVHGQVRDSGGRPVADSLVEVWQANAAGRYRHVMDQHPAPIDPNFTGLGRVLTDHQGRYRIVTIKPGAYPWTNHHNAWRPAHIHFSLFGHEFTQRLVTQMYFPDDPLFGQDPILNSIPDPRGRARLIAAYDNDATVPQWALGFRFDIVLRDATRPPFRPEHDHP